MNAHARLDPAVIDFVKALARANAARDIELARRSDRTSGNGQPAQRTAG
jgi:hypothetical protein